MHAHTHTHTHKYIHLKISFSFSYVGHWHIHYILCKTVENFKNKIKFKEQYFVKKIQNLWNIHEFSIFDMKSSKLINELIIKQKCVEGALVQMVLVLGISFSLADSHLS